MGTYANFYNSENNDRVYDADSFSEWLRPFFKTGVFNGELQVIASSGMEVIVDTGNAFIEGKLKKFDSQTTLTVEQASANSTRIDSVICRRNDTDRDFTLMIVKGTTVAPLPVRENGIYDIVLAHITVPASAVEIKQENITDTRMNADICGWVVSNVEEVDFSQVTAQWADYIANFEANELQAFNEWFDTIKGQLSTDQAGSLQLQIDEQANKIATNTANISANKADITNLQQTTSKNTSDIATNTSDIDNVKFGENSLSKNLVDWSKASHTLHGYGNGNIIYNNNYYGVLDYFETKGQKLTLSFNITSNVTNLWCSITLYDENKNYLRNVSGYKQELSVITNSNEKYATFVLYSGNTSLSKDDYYNVQLEYGDRTSYEPYIPSLKKLNKLNQLNPVTLGTSWTHDTANGYYTQSIICSGITSNDNPTVDVVLSGTLANMQAQQDEWSKILKVETSTDNLKFYAIEPTTVSLSVMVKGV